MTKIGRPRNEAPCSVGGCEGRGEIRGWCKRHYNRWYKTGSPVTPPKIPQGLSLFDRLMRRVSVRPSGCWEWQGAKSPLGHGYIGRGRRGEGVVGAHRVAWEHANGPIPPGMCVCHHCDNPPCVRPDHLFLGTRADNNKDMTRKGRHAAHIGTQRSLRGSQHHAATITEDTARAIRDASGTHAEVARQYGVSHFIAYRIRTGKTWTHV